MAATILVISYLFMMTRCIFSLNHFTAGVIKRIPQHPRKWITKLDDRSKHDAEQWELFRNTTVGFWKGLQTGYDPQDDDVEDYMYTEVTMEGSPGSAGEDEELTQRNGFVIGEIRADCEVCFDSERLRTKDVGVFREGSMGNRKCCANVDLRGPAPTKRGMSIEAGIRHKDGKVRILLSFSPIDYDENAVPLAMGLMDVVITRERLNKRPLKLDEDEGGWDVLWRETSEASFDRLSDVNSVLSCEMKQYVPNDEAKLVESPPLALTSLHVKSAGVHHNHDPYEGQDNDLDENDQFVYRRAFNGGLLVESEAIVYPGMPTRIRLVHAPSPQEPLVYSVDLAFSALERLSVDEVAISGEVRLRPPQLMDFSVAKRCTVELF